MELTEQIKTQKNAELRKRVYRAIQSMYKLFRGSSKDVQVVDKYMNIWKPKIDSIQDVVEFPYESKKGMMAEEKNTVHCLLALMTGMIKTWHLHCGDADDDCVELLETQLNKIEFIIKHQLQLPVRGSEVTGYYFKMPKGDG